MSVLSSPSFGALLRHYRLAAGITQEELAERSGLSPRAILALERGERHRPHRQTLGLLAVALRLSDTEAETLRRAAGYAASLAAAHEPPTTEAVSAVPPLAGRSRELASLERFLASSDPPVLLLAGEPGIGKSRLLQEAAHRALAGGFTVLQGGGRRRSGQEPYSPLLDTLAHSIVGLSPSRLRAALAGCGWLARLLPELVDIVHGPLPGGAPPADQERRLIFAAVARYLANIAGPAGALLVLDDLQWASLDGLDLLVSLVHAEGGAAIRVVGAYRETEVGPDHPLAALLAELAERRQVEHRTVGPLAKEDALALLDALLRGPLDERVKGRIVRRAGGVPFFLVSCAHGLEAGEGGEGVPWTVAQSVRHRVAALPPAARESLCGAAILGREIERAVLLRVVASPEDEVLAGLDAACRARLLVPGGRSAYRFAHDVVREAIEADLGQAERMLLHRKAAQALAAQPAPERRAAEIAWHFLEGDDTERALRFALLAGDHAETLSALAEAEQHYRTALELARERGDQGREARALAKLGWILKKAARYDEALDMLERAAQMCRGMGDLEGEARSVAHLGQVHSARGTPEEGITRLRDVIESLEGQPESNRPSHGLAELYEALTYLLLFGTGRYGEALAATERQEELARTLGRERLSVRARALRSLALSASGISTEDGLHLAEAVIPVAEAQNDLDSLSLALIVAGEVHRLGGRLEEARAYKERSIQVTQRKGDQAEIAFALGNLAETLLLLGDWEQARILCERQAHMAPPSERTWVAAYPLLGLGEICSLRGEWSHASHYLQEALDIATRNQDLQGIWMAQLRLAELDLLEGQAQSALARLEPLVGHGGMHLWDTTLVLLALAQTHLEIGDQNRATELVTQAIERAKARDEGLHLVEALRINGMVLRRRSRWEEAGAAFDEALSLARSMPYPYQAARILYEQGKMQAQQPAPGASQRARERLEEARETFRRLGARPYIERTEQALAALR